MGTPIHLDSIFRNREVYPNEHEYDLLPEQVTTWFATPRNIRSDSDNPSKVPKEFATTVHITDMTLPYTTATADMIRVYVNFETIKYRDKYLISTINGTHSDIKFICVRSGIVVDNANNPIAVSFVGTFEQTMRFARGHPVTLSIRDRFGATLPQQDTSVPVAPNPLAQTVISFQTTPYIRDADYSNHMVSPYQMV